MIDRSREIVELQAVHLPGADLGRGTAMVDSDALTVVGTDGEDRRVRVPLSMIDAIELFDPRAIDTAIGAVLTRFATERYGENAPARRALEAELTDLAEPLHEALEALGEAAVIARQADGDLRLWRTWCSALKVTFEVADRVWLALDAALDAAMYGAS